MTRSSLSTDIAASPDLVFRLASDPLRWPALLPHYIAAKELANDGDARLIEFVARRSLVPLLGLGVPVAWRSRTWSEPAGRRLRFRHIGGATRGMDVTWRIEGNGAGCRVTIEHIHRPGLPAWAVVLDRLFVRPIATRTLATFKAIAEALDDRETESRPARRTNPSP